MKRILLSVTAIALGITIAAAQQDPIKERKDLMKGLGDQAKAGGAMAKGDQPFDLAKAQKIFAAFENAASKAPALFPPNSSDEPTADDPYTASPKVWQDIKPYWLGEAGCDLTKKNPNAQYTPSSPPPKG